MLQCWHVHVIADVCVCQWRPLPYSHHLMTSDLQIRDLADVIVYIAPFCCWGELWMSRGSVIQFCWSSRHLQSGADAQETRNNEGDDIKQNPSVSLSTGHREWTQPKPGQCNLCIQVFQSTIWLSRSVQPLYSGHPINCLSSCRSVQPLYSGHPIYCLTVQVSATCVFRSSNLLFDYPGQCNLCIQVIQSTIWLSRSVDSQIVCIQIIQSIAWLHVGQCNLCIQVIQSTSYLHVGQGNIWFHSGHPIRGGVLKLSFSMVTLLCISWELFFEIMIVVFVIADVCLLTVVVDWSLLGFFV